MGKYIAPCPFCGGTEIECHQYDEDGDYAAMFCRKKECGASGPIVDTEHNDDNEYDEEAEERTKEKALAVWNKRAALKEGK